MLRRAFPHRVYSALEPGPCVGQKFYFGLFALRFCHLSLPNQPLTRLRCVQTCVQAHFGLAGDTQDLQIQSARSIRRPGTLGAVG